MPEVNIDTIRGGRGHGDVASVLLENEMNPDALRPWKGRDGRSYVTVKEGVDNEGKPKYKARLSNATATLRKDEWQLLDTAILEAAQQRLRLVADLRAAGLTFNIPDGMGTTVFQFETQSDITAADISMKANTRHSFDRPEYELRNLPLPIISKDFFFDIREISASRKLGQAIDTTTAQLAARKVSEHVEKLAIGELSAFQFAGASVQGLTNFTHRLTKTLTNPTSAGWTPATLVQEVLQMKKQSQNNSYFGPWVIYNSPAWDEYLDDDYSSSKGTDTLRDRLLRIEGINDVRTLDFLSDTPSGVNFGQLILVQQTSDVIRMVIGMDVRTVQWETLGGLEQHWKVMTIMVPQLRSDHTNQTGIVHGSV